MLELNLEKDKIYSIYVEVSGDEGYGSGFGEDWCSTYSGLIRCTKDVILTSSELADILGGNWYNYKFNAVKFNDVTDLVKELNDIKLEMDNFDWNNRDYNEYNKLDDSYNELDSKIEPNYLCSISIDKTI